MRCAAKRLTDRGQGQPVKGSVQEEVLQALRASKKYSHACEDVLRRTAEWASMRHRSSRAATKAAKRKLHQVYGAFFEKIDFQRIAVLLDGLSANAPHPIFEHVCREILASHASTAERLPWIDDFYPAIFEKTGTPRSVLDLACGLNPFALPWMGLGPETSYAAYDLDQRLADAINRFFERYGLPPGAICADLLTTVPDSRVDVVLLLKTLPTLERQRKAIAINILRKLDTRFAVISFPTKTLGGKGVGMARHYDVFMDSILQELGTGVETLTLGDETVYILALKPRNSSPAAR